MAEDKGQEPKMVKVRALKNIATGSLGKNSDYKVYKKGEVFEVPKEEAERLCKFTLPPEAAARGVKLVKGRGQSAEYVRSN